MSILKVRKNKNLKAESSSKVNSKAKMKLNQVQKYGQMLLKLCEIFHREISSNCMFWAM